MKASEAGQLQAPDVKDNFPCASRTTTHSCKDFSTLLQWLTPMCFDLLNHAYEIDLMWEKFIRPNLPTAGETGR